VGGVAEAETFVAASENAGLVTRFTSGAGARPAATPPASDVKALLSSLRETTGSWDTDSIPERRDGSTTDPNGVVTGFAEVMLPLPALSRSVSFALC
jgi:hypothetical protein